MVVYANEVTIAQHHHLPQFNVLEDIIVRTTDNQIHLEHVRQVISVLLKPLFPTLLMELQEIFVLQVNIAHKEQQPQQTVQ